MGIFDIFSTGPAQDASRDLNRGITTGLNQYNQYAQQGQNALNTNYAAGLQPFQQNYATSQGGTTALGNLLGLNGAAGGQSAQQALENMPGYQFQLGQGNANILANQAATGQLGSGATDLALQKYGQGLAGTNYQNYVQNLMPYLGMAQSSAQGIGGLYSGLGNQLNQSFQNQANANYGGNAAIGQSNANADLSRYNASGNLLNFMTNLFKGGAGAGGQMGGASPATGIGNFLGSIGSGVGNLFGGMQNSPNGALPTGLAEGGRPPMDRPSLVGERGPELFMPDRPGTVMPHHAIAQYLKDAGRSGPMLHPTNNNYAAELMRRAA